MSSNLHNNKSPRLPLSHPESQPLVEKNFGFTAPSIQNGFTRKSRKMKVIAILLLLACLITVSARFVIKGKRPYPDDDEDICMLPFDSGNCFAATPRWYFNFETKHCEPFEYGGCDGNENRFQTQKDCQLRCGYHREETSPDVCPVQAECPTSVQVPSGHRYTHCSSLRERDIAAARQWYLITDEKKPSRILFPFAEIPWLNQTMQSIGMHYTLDEFESRWLTAFSFWSKTMTSVIKPLVQAKFSAQDFYDINEYRAVYMAFTLGIQSLKTPQYFSNPSMYPTFFNVISTEEWNSDRVFAQRRLAATCPFSLRKLTFQGEIGLSWETLKSKINEKNLQILDKSLQTVSEDETLSIDEAVEEGLLFVLYHEVHNDIETLKDIQDKDPTDTRNMINATSPISFFYLDTHGHLHVFAIQVDYHKGSPMFTPESHELDWMLAKSMVELSDKDYCQAYVHLGQIHMSTSQHCLTYRRHFSQQHPMHVLMKHHCEGTTPHISLAYTALSLENSYGHTQFAMGHTGFNKLLLTAYRESHYRMFSLDTLIKQKGLDDERISYYPFRDDSQLIHHELTTFANKFVNIFYCHHDHCEDDKVANDTELQAYVNELSADGVEGQEAGLGKIKDLPAAFTTIDELKEYVLRFLWFNIVHASSNYPLAPEFVPLSPPKLYNDTQQDINIAHFYPDTKVTTGLTFLSNLLGNFRINRLMDYSEDIGNRRLRHLVHQTYQRLNTCVQKTLEERNAQRFAEKMLTYQYLEPKWLTNSIHV